MFTMKSCFVIYNNSNNLSHTSIISINIQNSSDVPSHNAVCVFDFRLTHFKLACLQAFVRVRPPSDEGLNYSS